MLTPFFLHENISLVRALGVGALERRLLAQQERGKSERTLEWGASRVRVTSSDDSRVDRNACA